MAFIRAKHADRIRATPFDEQTEEERMWVVLDRILNPDQYLQAEVYVQSDIEAEDFVPPPQPKPIPPGDMYEEQRLQYELGVAPQNLNPPLEPGWVCPHDEMGLLTLLNTPESMVQEEEDIKIRYLMEKYYVAPELSHMGRTRRAAVGQLEDETRVLAESARLSEEMHERQLTEGGSGAVTAVPWMDPATGRSTRRRSRQKLSGWAWSARRSFAARSSRRPAASRRPRRRRSRCRSPPTRMAVEEEAEEVVVAVVVAGEVVVVVVAAAAIK